MFGAAKPAASIFGAAPTTGGLFGASTSGYGAPAFGAAPATPGYGAPTAGGGLFGAASAAPAFGAAPATPFGAASFPGASPFGAAPAAPATPFGASTFGAAPTAAPAFGSAFGAPAAATPFGAAAGSAFGAAAPSTGFPFGAGAAKPAAAPFGAAPAFGAPAGGGGGGLFGAVASTPSAFGAPAASAFGAPATGGLFGAPAAASTPAFGAAATTPGAYGSAFGGAGAFGAPTAAGSIFGGAGAAVGGTKFQPVTETETNGTTNVQVKFQSITAMPQASGLSFEEIRLQDYVAGRKGGNMPTAAPTTGLFGAPTAAAPAYGAPTASPFGAPIAAPAFGAAPATGLFGAPAAAPTTFGAPAAGGLFGAPAASPATSLFGAPAPAAASPFGAPAGGLFGAPTSAATSSMFGASAPAFGAPASTAAFGSGLSGGLGAFSSLPTAAPAAPLLSFPGLGAPAAAPTSSIFSSLPAPSPYGTATASSLFSTTTPALSFPGAGGIGAFPAFGAPGVGSTATSLLGAQPTFEVRLNTPGAFGALPAVATSLYVPTAPAASLSIAPASTPASVGKKPVMAPLLRMTPSSAAKLKPRSSGRSFVYDSLSDPAAAAVPEAFAPRSDLRRLILEPEDAPAPARAMSAPSSALPAASPATAVSPVSPSLSVAYNSAPSSGPNGNNSSASGGVLKPKPTKPPRGLLPVYTPSDSPLASPLPEVLADLAPLLTRPDYYTEPAIELLQRMTEEELRRVKNFAVGRTGIGCVAFEAETDVRTLNLDELVHFSSQPREIEVYPDGSLKPDIGRGLNKPATVTLEACFPAAKPGASSTDPDRLIAYEERLRKFTANIDGAQFVSYDKSTGRWTFRVRHFSKYGLAGLDDDDEGEGDKPQAKRAAQPPPAATSAKPVAKPAAVAATSVPVVPATLRFFDTRAPLRSPAAPALSIEEPEDDDEEEVIRPRGIARQHALLRDEQYLGKPHEEELEEQVEMQQQQQQQQQHGEEDMEPIESYGTLAIEEPEDAEFAEGDNAEESGLVAPPRHRIMHAQRREQMRESLFHTGDDEEVQQVDEEEEQEEDDEQDVTMAPPPTLSLLPKSLFPPRGVRSIFDLRLICLASFHF